MEHMAIKKDLIKDLLISKDTVSITFFYLLHELIIPKTGEVSVE